MTPHNISYLHLNYPHEGNREGVCDPAITSLFKNGKQWANLTDFTVGNFDIREHSVGDIGNWMKEQKKLNSLKIANCFMTPVILAEILDYVEEYLKTNPHDWDHAVSFNFDQLDKLVEELEGEEDDNIEFVNRGVQATSDSSEEHSSYEGSQSPNILRRSMSKISR